MLYIYIKLKKQHFKLSTYLKHIKNKFILTRLLMMKYKKKL
jgi:hypothetical protein